MEVVSRVKRPNRAYEARARKLVRFRQRGWTWGKIAEKFNMHRANVRRTVIREMEKANAEKETRKD